MIERLVVDNFKSIQHADVSLHRINLLIGPNNSGKSNFLSIFSSIKNRISSTSDFTGFTERNKENKLPSLNIHLNKQEITIQNGEMVFPEVTTTNFFRVYHQFIYDLRNSHIYKIQIDSLKREKIFDIKANQINGSGENMASFLQIVLNKHRTIFKKITEDLVQFNNEFEEIVLDFLENNKIKVGLKNKENTVFWSDELSEGVLYFLCILCIVNQPEPPKYLFIEEPETGIHPRRIKEVIDLIKELAEEKDIQVFMTTHSPLVVDLFEDEPECIHIFEMLNGITEIKNLKFDVLDPIYKELEESGIKPQKEYYKSLGQQWINGFLGGVPV